jgi:hypothetical protein
MEILSYWIIIKENSYLILDAVNLHLGTPFPDADEYGRKSSTGLKSIRDDRTWK